MAEPQANVETTDIGVPEVMHIEDVTGRGAGASPQEPRPEPTEADASTTQRVNDIRKSQMDEIAARRQEAMVREIGLAEIMADEAREAAGLEPLPGADATPTAPPVERPAQAAPPAATAPVPGAAAQPAKRKVKVYGQEIEIDEGQFDALLQKGVAFDQAAREAAHYRKIVETGHQPQPVAQPQPQQPSQHVQQPTPAAAAVDPARIKEIQRRISYGSDEEQQAAIHDLIVETAQQATRGMQPQVDPNRIVQVAVQQAKAEQVFENNLQTVAREFPELFEDEDLTLIAARKVGNLRAAYQQVGVQKSDLELYREAASHTTGKYLKPSAAQPIPTAQSQPPAQAAQPPASSRVERKRAAPQPPASASQRAPTNADSYQAPSPKAIVAAMRRSRHQPAYD